MGSGEDHYRKRQLKMIITTSKKIMTGWIGIDWEDNLKQKWNNLVPDTTAEMMIKNINTKGGKVTKIIYPDFE